MTISDRIRRAALGPTPCKDPGAIMFWCGDDANKVWRFCLPNGDGYDFRQGTDTERRMFLLFVAEALEEP